MSRFNLDELERPLSTAKVVALYFLPQFFCDASQVALELKQRFPDVSFMVLITCSSGVDTMQYRMGTKEDSPDVAVYFGASCLCSTRYSQHLPTYFVPVAQEPESLEYIRETINKNLDSSSQQKVLFLSDLTNSEYLKCDLLVDSTKSADVCQYLVPEGKNLHFLESTSSLVCSEVPQTHDTTYFPFVIPEKLAEYDLVVYLGECKNLEIVINSRRILIIDPLKRDSEVFDGAKEFRKRVSLIEKFKTQSLNMVGIVFVNYTQSVSSTMEIAKQHCRKQKRSPFFLTLNQSDYELRLGNFGQLDGFVLVNGCECNFEIVRATSKYFCPVVFWREFQIISGERLVYGGIEWNTEPSEDDQEEEEEVDEDQMRLVDRDMFKKPENTWYGLVVDAGNSAITPDIQEGLSGIASAYTTENELF